MIEWLIDWWFLIYFIIGWAVTEAALYGARAQGWKPDKYSKVTVFLAYMVSILIWPAMLIPWRKM